MGLIQPFKRQSRVFTIEGIPGLLFYFNSEDTVGAAPATWVDRTGTCEVIRAGGNLRFDTLWTSATTQRGFITENDLYSHIQRIGGAQVFPSGQAYPTDVWMVCVVAVDCDLYPQDNRAYLSTTTPLMELRSYTFPGLVYPNARCGNGAAWNNQHYNNFTDAVGAQGITPNKHHVMFIQNTSVNGTGRMRMHGVERNYIQAPGGVNDFSTSGSAGTHVGIGCRYVTANSLTRSNIRAAICGSGRLTLEEIENMEGILAADTDTTSYLPSSHPWAS